MADHLPECTHDTRVNDWCICDRLRQAEQRGFHRGWRTAEAYWRKVSIRYGRRKVQECRDAVAALPANPAGYSYGIPRLDKDAALAAIDKLRGETND